MYKKIILIIMTTIIIIGCDLFKESESGNSIIVELKSKPTAENADTTVYFKYLASEGNTGADKFLYSYTLSEVSGTNSAIVYKYPESGTSGPNIDVEFKKLKNGTGYIFKVKGYNIESGAVSNELSYKFRVKYDYKLSYGIVSDENDLYGESSGILKKGQKFKVYATLINSDITATETLLKSTNVSLKINLSGFNGAVLSSGYGSEQDLEVNSTTGAIWEITAPEITTSGSIKLEVVESPYYSTSNIIVIEKDLEIKAEARDAGTLSLTSFTPESDSAKLGESFDFTVVLKNEGDTSVVLSKANINFYDSLRNDISSKWTTAESLVGTVIPANTTVTKTISYTVSNSSDLGDVYIVFSGTGYEALSKEVFEVESEEKTVFITSQ